MKGDSLLNGWEKKCPICGKRFWATPIWSYKTGKEGCYRYYCSWKCLRKMEEEKKK